MGISTTATDIIIDDNTSAANGTYFTVAEIVAAVTAADAIRVDSGTGFPTYRFLKNLVVGGATSNATTLQDVNCCLTFDSTRILRTRTTNLTNVGITFGTRVGSGNTGSGGNGVIVSLAEGTITSMAIRGTVKIYGTRICKKFNTTVQALQFPQLNSGSEIVNCQFDGFTNYVFGSSGANLGLAYNVDITRPDTINNIITAFFVDVADRLTISSLRAADSSAAISSNTAGGALKDVVFFGDFSGGAIPGAISLGASATNWIIARPQWPTGINLYSNVAPGTADIGAHQYWEFDPKVVDGLSGDPISGIPVKLTDALGNVQVDTTTDSEGRVMFGSGIAAGMAIVSDQYAAGTRTRSPFLAEFNTGSSANGNYPSVRYYYDQPGEDDGRYTAVRDIVPLRPAGGGPTGWVEIQV